MCYIFAVKNHTCEKLVQVFLALIVRLCDRLQKMTKKHVSLEEEITPDIWQDDNNGRGKDDGKSK